MVSDYYRQHFSASVYDNLLLLQQAILERRESFTFSGCSVSEMERCMYILPFEYPLIYNVFLNESTMDGNATISLSYHDFDENKLYERLNYIQTEIQKKISYNMSQYEIVKTIYDYITSNFTYDTKALDAASDIDTADKTLVRKYNEKYGSNFSMYGPLVNKKGVCSGLCQLFKYLLNTFGIDAICITGFYKRDEEVTTLGHSVVLVEIDGNQAFIDIASGMKNMTGVNMTAYNLFMVSKEEILVNFEPMFSEYQFNDLQEDLSYFKVYGMEFENIERLSGFFMNMIDSRKEIKIHAKYTGKVLKQRQLEKLVNDIVAKKKGYKYKYYVNVKKNIINTRIFQGKDEE